MSPLPGSARVLLASLLAIPLAFLSGAHAFSSASLRHSPELALAVFPFNGLAQEKVAYRSLVAGIQKASGKSDGTDLPNNLDGNSSSLGLAVSSADLMNSATSVADAARGAIRLEPLSPRAFVILALSDQDPAQRQRIVQQASRLTKRDLALQTLVLKSRGEAGDYAGAINTLDEILRVHPERKTEFFPLLVQALGDKATIPEFARLLGKPLPWRDAFLNFALTDQNAIANLAVVRERIATDDKEFDRRLIAQLVDSGQVSSAERIYRLVGGARVPDANAAQFSWNSDYPPFDWKLSDQAGFRAQVGNRPDILEIDIAPGNGGVIASRLVRNLQVPFMLSLAHDIEPAGQTKDMKLTIACSGQSKPFFERPFAESASSFAVDQVPSCPYLLVSIWARSWTDARALTGTLSPVVITAKRHSE